MVMGAVLVGVYLLVGLVCSNDFRSSVGMSVGNVGAGLIKFVWELCWWECS